MLFCMGKMLKSLAVLKKNISIHFFFSVALNLWQSCIIEKGVCVREDVGQASCEESGSHEYRQLVSPESTRFGIALHFTIQLRLSRWKRLGESKSNNCSATVSLKRLMLTFKHICVHLFFYFWTCFLYFKYSLEW